MSTTAREALERAARDRFGRLVARLAQRTGDIALAEDVFSDALVAALETWPRAGIPQAPQAWLIAVAKRKSVDTFRRNRRKMAAAEHLSLLAEEAATSTSGAGTDVAIPDSRLQLMFVCAHPAIAEPARAPLMLQVLLGIDAARIAEAFLIPPATISQRLVRAKSKIRDAAIGFALPDAADWPDRMRPVLDAIYAAYTLGRTSDQPGDQLETEACWLAELASQAAPQDPEARGLHSLLLFCEARRLRSGRNSDAYEPIALQAPESWRDDIHNRADALLAEAARLSTPGRYQIEAAIQSVHMDRRRTGETNWSAILDLYGALLAVQPSTGAQVSRAAALCEAGQPELAFDALAALSEASIRTYQPYWAILAHTLSRLRQVDQAVVAYDTALCLTTNAALRDYLSTQRAQLGARMAPTSAP